MPHKSKEKFLKYYKFLQKQRKELKYYQKFYTEIWFKLLFCVFKTSIWNKFACKDNTSISPISRNTRSAHDVISLSWLFRPPKSPIFWISLRQYLSHSMSFLFLVKDFIDQVRDFLRGRENICHLFSVGLSRKTLWLRDGTGKRYSGFRWFGG